MNTRIRKAVRDLRIHPWRTALVISALVIGLWGAGSLVVSFVILRHDLRENFVRTAPPHLILTSNDFHRLDLESFRRRLNLESAEFRGLSLERIEVYPDDWIPLYLFGVDDFDQMSLAKIASEEGLRAPPPGTMLIERDGRLISNLRPGVRARVRVQGQIREVLVAGIAFDPAQAPATQDHFIYAYVDKATYQALTGKPFAQRLVLRVKDAVDQGTVRRSADRITKDLQSQGIRLSTLQIPKLNEHPHQWQLNTLLLLQGSIGFLALLMGALLVSQLMAAIMAQQVRQIGILKAVGASRLHMLEIYTAMVLAMGLTAAVVAVPLAVSTGTVFSRFVAFKLNFDILTTRLPVSVYISLGAASLAMPFIFSLPTLIRGMRMSVHQALSDHGIPPDMSSRPTWRVDSLFMSPGFRLALRNAFRRKSRLAGTVMTMALGVAIFETGFNVRRSLWTLLSEVRDGMGHDIQVVLAKPLPRKLALAPFQKLGDVSRIEPWNGGKGELQSGVVSTDDGVGIVALPYDTDLYRVRVEEGRWLEPSDVPEVVLNQKAIELFGHPKVGQRVGLKLAGKLVSATLVGNVWELDRPKVYMDRSQFDSLANPDHLVNSLMFVAKEKGYGQVINLKTEIEKAIAPTRLNVLYVMSQAERVKVIYDHLNIILTTIVLLALTVLVVSALGMASATGINILERTREIGVLRAVGATPARIYSLFVTEGLMVTAASVGLGILISWPLSKAAAPFFGRLMLGDGASLRFVFDPAGFWITLGTTLAFGWLASLLPARRAVQVSTHQALSYE